MTLNHKNISIHYKVEGDGDPVILLHGFLENLSMWNAIVPELSKSHLVISIDLLGHGKTGCLGYVHTMEDMAKAVAAVLKHLKVNRGTIIGHSMGGYVGLALAEKQPQLCEGLCLMNSTFEADDNERKKLRTRSITLAKSNYNALVGMSFANLFAPKSKLKFQDAFKEGLDQALRTPVQGYIAAQEGMKLRPNRFEVFKNIDGKKLIIAGKKDSLIDTESLRKKLENKSIDYEILSEGHMSHIENMEELTYLLLRFIEK